MLASPEFLAALQKAKSTKRLEHVKVALKLLNEVDSNSLTSSQEKYADDREAELRAILKGVENTTDFDILDRLVKVEETLENLNKKLDRIESSIGDLSKCMKDLAKEQAEVKKIQSTFTAWVRSNFSRYKYPHAPDFPEAFNEILKMFQNDHPDSKMLSFLSLQLLKDTLSKQRSSVKSAFKNYMFTTYNLDIELYDKCKYTADRPNWVKHCLAKLKKWKPGNTKFPFTVLETQSIPIAEHIFNDKASISDTAFINALLIGFLSGELEISSYNMVENYQNCFNQHTQRTASEEQGELISQMPKSLQNKLARQNKQTAQSTELVEEDMNEEEESEEEEGIFEEEDIPTKSSQGKKGAVNQSLKKKTPPPPRKKSSSKGAASKKPKI